MDTPGSPASPEFSEYHSSESFVGYFEPSVTKKWKCLRSWEQYVEAITSIESAPDGKYLIYFKLKGEDRLCKERSSVCGEKFPRKLLQFYESECSIVGFLEPSTTEKWSSLPSWEKYIESIDTVKRIKGDDIFIYFKLKGENATCREHTNVCADKFPHKLLEFYSINLEWREEEDGEDGEDEDSI